MAIEISQSLASDISLFSDSYTQNQSSNSFQGYLDEEQKRLALLFSPFNSFDFSAWFAYPAFSNNNITNKFNESIKTAENAIDYPEYYSSSDTNSSFSPQNNTALPIIGPLSGSNAAFNPQKIIENILLKNGLLTPNIEALPQFLQASMNKQFLPAIDLQSLVDEILAQVKLVKDKGKTELIVGLKPDNLGEILLTLTATSGMISIQIESNEKSRKLLEDNLSNLKIALKKAKVNLAGITITAIKEGKQNA